MLKGHTKIELKNVNTGKVRTVEHSNMITNAVANILKLHPIPYNSYQSNFYIENAMIPLCNKGMGGLLCFENQLEENADNISIPNPSDNAIIAYADSTNVVSTDTKKGIKNLTESSAFENGYKFVWDFNTSQGNGQISALALSHNDFCNALTRDKSLDSSTISGNDNNHRVTENMKELLYGAVKYNPETDIITCLHTVNGGTVQKIQRRLGFKCFGITDKPLGCKRLNIQNILITEEANITQYLEWREGDDGYYYGVYRKSGKLHVRRINVSTLQYDNSFKLDISHSDFNYGVIQVDTYIYENQGYFEILDGYIYTTAYGNSKFIITKVNLNNSSDITSKQYTYGYGTNRLVPIVRCKDHLVSSGCLIFKDLTIQATTTILNETSFNRFLSYNQVGFLKFYGGSTTYTAVSLYLTSDYLATINNLDTPVTKTSQDVMKVTYTITEV